MVVVYYFTDYTIKHAKAEETGYTRGRRGSHKYPRTDSEERYSPETGKNPISPLAWVLNSIKSGSSGQGRDGQSHVEVKLVLV